MSNFSRIYNGFKSQFPTLDTLRGQGYNDFMKKLVLWALIALLSFTALSENLPPQEGLDAASALAGLHDAVTRDVLKSDFRFSELAGAGDFYVLFSDVSAKNYLMVSLWEEDRRRADMAVIQTSSLTEFLEHALLSLTALTLPFLTDGEQARCAAWRENCRAEILEKLRTDEDYELNYFVSDYVSCALSVYHDETGVLFTALADWAHPMSAEDISALTQAR